MTIKTVSTFWQGELTLYNQACLLSFLHQGFEVEVYSYQNLELPVGIILKDAHQILSKDWTRRYTHGGKSEDITAFSDLFRYQLLLTHGGMWVDADVFCLRPHRDFQDLLPQSGGRAIFAWQDNRHINTGVIISKKNHPVLHKMVTYAKEINPILKEWGAIGPMLATDMEYRFPELLQALEPQTFYPIHYHDFAYLLLPEYYDICASKLSNSYTLHFWNAFFKTFQIPQNKLPPKGSYLHKLFCSVVPDSDTCLDLDELNYLLSPSNP